MITTPQGFEHAPDLRERRRNVGGAGERGEDSQERDDLEAAIGVRKRPCIANDDHRRGRPGPRGGNPVGQYVEAMKCGADLAATGERGEPPPGAAPYVEDLAGGAKLRPGEGERRGDELVAHRPVTWILGVPALLLAGARGVATVDRRHPLPLVRGTAHPANQLITVRPPAGSVTDRTAMLPPGSRTST